MTPREELQALLERVERAEGPDRELSRDIYASLGWTRNILPGGMWLEPNGPPVREPADCTASVDAALALVERKLPGWELEITSEHRDGEVIWRVGLGDPRMGWDGEANTLALAIVAALLAALMASPESPAAVSDKGPGKPENETPRERAG